MEWACSRCTFLNSDAPACEMCGAEKPGEAGDDSGSEIPENAGPDDVKDPAEAASSRKRKSDEVGEENADPISRKRAADEVAKDQVSALHISPTNALLRQLHMERMARKVSISDDHVASSSSSNPSVEQDITIMTYNVWFREDIELEKRMAGIGDLIREHQPHVICLQEVTLNVYTIFQRSSWWSSYSCSVSPQLAATRAYFCIQLSKLPVEEFSRAPFKNSVMGRELCLANLNAGNNLKLVVATTHLESPCPAPPTWDQMYRPERVAQSREAFGALSHSPNVIFGGDMNWDDKQDGPIALDDGWCDAWLKLRPNEPGLTYDSKMNPMLGSGRLQKRLDRVFCRLRDFELRSIEMIGTKPLPGVSYVKEKIVRKQKQLLTLPVLPSDHFGLVLKITRKI